MTYCWNSRAKCDLVYVKDYNVHLEQVVDLKDVVVVGSRA